MVAYFNKPHFEQSGETKREGTIETGSSRFEMGEAQENQTKLKQLEHERDRLQKLSYVIGFAGIAALAVFSPSAIVTLPPLGAVLGDLQTTSQRFFLMTELINAFENEGIEIEIGLKPEGLREIDFFLRFPSDKEYILIQVRSLGDAKVVFNEEREALQFRKKGGGLKNWKPDPLGELIEQERWLRRQRSDLLGNSSRDRRRPIAKLLILATVTTLGDHPEPLYATMDSGKYLTLRKMGTSSIVTQNQVIDFIQAYLSSRRSPKTS